jgi:hypothetical protein
VPDLARFPPNRVCKPDSLGRLSSDRRPFFFILTCNCRGGYRRAMLYLVIKAALSGVIVAAVSEIARRYPGWGGLVASLPLTSLLAMLWLYRDTGDPGRVAELSMGAFWFILPSLPMFAVLPALLRSGAGFWVSMALSIAGTLALYALMFWAAPKLGIKL